MDEEDITRLFTQFDYDTQGPQSLPCFDSWHSQELQITAALVVCCVISSGSGCLACAAGASAAYAVNLVSFYDCEGNY